MHAMPHPLTRSQRRLLHEQVLLTLAKLLLLLALWLGFFMALLPSATGFIFAPGRKFLLLLTPVYAGFIWRHAPQQLRLLWRDLQTQSHSEHIGSSAVQQFRAFGLLAPLHTQLQVGALKFNADRFQAAALMPGQTIVVRFASHSKLLFSVSSLNAKPSTSTWSRREQQLLTLLVEGCSDKLIARQLQLSPATVRTYNNALFRKLGVSDRVAAAHYAREHGLVDVN